MTNSEIAGNDKNLVRTWYKYQGEAETDDICVLVGDIPRALLAAGDAQEEIPLRDNVPHKPWQGTRASKVGLISNHYTIKAFSIITG